MKLLVIDLQNPGKSKYIAPESAGCFMLARRLDNYRFFTLNDAGGLFPVVLNSPDCEKIQNEIDKIFKK